MVPAAAGLSFGVDGSVLVASIQMASPAAVSGEQSGKKGPHLKIEATRAIYLKGSYRHTDMERDYDSARVGIENRHRIPIKRHLRIGG